MDWNLDLDLNRFILNHAFMAHPLSGMKDSKIDDNSFSSAGSSLPSVLILFNNWE